MSSIWNGVGPRKAVDTDMSRHFEHEKEPLVLQKPPRRYVLLDRNGVINRRNSNEHGKCWDKFEFLPRALDALRLLAANHYAGIVISRQACYREALASSSELDAITRRFLLEVALSGGHIAQVYYCPHGKEDVCNCYNPGAGLIAQAKADHGFLAEETYFVSEGEFELQAAEEEGCACIRIQRDAFLQTAISRKERYKIASNLYEAAEQILASSPVREREYATFQLR
jgi:D-glycero-D-manno-heptose 1,7-bisphosphate phosphatase